MSSVYHVRKGGRFRSRSPSSGYLMRAHGAPASFTRKRAPAPQATNEGRRRYSLSELLVGAEHVPSLYASVAGALDGAPVGNEIG